MQCSRCKRPMIALFYSAVCDYCERQMPTESLYRGFVVYRGQRSADGDEEYVFRTRADAERWRRIAGREGCEIREVYSLNAFRWHKSRGSARDLELADHLFKIFPDHRYEPLPHRAFLA